MKIRLSDYVVFSDPLDQKNDLKSERIAFSTRTGKGIKITNYVTELIKAHEFSQIPDRLFTILMYHEIIVPEDEDELDMVVNRKLLTSRDVQAAEMSLLIQAPANTSNFLDQIESKIRNIQENAGRNNLPFQFTLVFVVDELEAGFHTIDQVRSRVNTINISHPLTATCQIVFRNCDLGSLSDFLPLNNPYFERLTFCCKEGDHPHALHEILKNLCTAASRNAYMGILPIDLCIALNNNRLQYDAAALVQLKKINAFSNIKLSFYFARSASVEKDDETAMMEMDFLSWLHKHQLKCSFFPFIDQKFWLSGSGGKQGEYTDELHSAFRLQADEMGEYRASGVQMVGRRNYSDDFAGSIRGKKILCSSCIYLPMCGGRAEKLADTDSDCPVFIRNFIKKVQYMYNFSLENAVYG